MIAIFILSSFNQEIMKAVVADPKVMSVLEKRKGQKGHRELQGDVLRELLLSLIIAQVGV